jgi:hypothetical protein
MRELQVHAEMPMPVALAALMMPCGLAARELERLWVRMVAMVVMAVMAEMESQAAPVAMAALAKLLFAMDMGLICARAHLILVMELEAQQQEKLVAAAMAAMAVMDSKPWTEEMHMAAAMVIRQAQVASEELEIRQELMGLMAMMALR